MEFSKKQPALLYLDKNGFYFFEAGLSAVISLAFLETSVLDMDVVDGVSIATQIKSFIEQYQITPATITMILSPNITFEKDVVGLPHDEQDDQIKKFTETIPFESILSKSYPIENGVKIIGCNEELYTELKSSFEKFGFSIDSIVPYQLLGNDNQLIQNLTTENASQFLRHVSNFRQMTMFHEKEKTVPTQTKETKKSPATKKPNIRLFVMAGIFVILFVILGYMLLHMK